MRYQVLENNTDRKCCRAIGVQLNRCDQLAIYRYITSFKGIYGKIIEYFVYVCQEHTEIRENN